MLRTSPFRQRLHFLTSGIRQFFAGKTVLSNLILANVIIFVLLLVMRGLIHLGGWLFQTDIPVDAWMDANLAFSSNPETFLHHPWTIVTNLFIHGGFWHIFFNMFMLYVFGKLFLQYLSSKQLLITYLIGGIVGNLFFMAAYQLFPAFENIAALSTCVGASGAVMAILLAVTIYRPNHPINLLLIGQTKLKWVAVLFIVIDLLSIGGGNAGGHFAHLGGALYGAIAAIFFQIGNPFKKVVFQKDKKKYYTSPKYAQGSRPMSDADFNAKKRSDEKKADAILDKISKAGYGALTKEERDFLYHYKR